MTAGYDCTQCGATIEQCNAHIKEHGEGCCEFCFVQDAHGLLSKPVDEIDALTDRINKVENNLLAQMVLLRTDLMDAIKLAGETVAKQHQRIDKLEEQLRHFDHNQAVVDYGLLDNQEAELEDRVDILERCIADMERIFKLRRRA